MDEQRPADPAPDDAFALAGAHLQRAIEAARADDAAAAIAACRAALAAAPGFVAAHANLGLLLVATGQAASAEPHLAIAAGRAPQDAPLRDALAQARVALGNASLRQGREVEAIAHYRRVPEGTPAHVEALNNLGGCLRRAGDLAGARAAFERVLALRPDQVEAHCNLAQLKTYARDDPQVGQLLAQAHRLPALPAHGRIRFWFTAGKMLEDVGRHDEAFAAYREGNALKHAAAPWDTAAHADALRRVARAFDATRLRRDAGARADPDGAGPVPVFVVGMPRSGTSLLEQVLSRLPGVHGAGEIDDLEQVIRAEAGAAPAPEALAARSAEDLLRLGRRYRERLRRLAPGATHVVDKRPVNFVQVGLIHLALPDARIVHATRDPMDSCFSCWSRLFAGDNLPFAYDLESLGRYWRALDALMRHWHAALPPGRVLEVSYEAFVADFEAQARRLVAHLGLPWDERCLSFHDSERVVRTASVAQVRRPIYRTSVARWKPFEGHLAALRALVGDQSASV